MKRKIDASESIDIYSAFDGAFSSIAGSFDREYYELKIDNECNLTAEAIQDTKYMPTIEITTTQTDGKYWFSPKLTFPTLDYEDMEFYDSIAHWTRRWSEIGKLMSELAEFYYDPSEWSEE